MPLKAGATLGPYQIDAPLGAGGMGEVYEATDTRLDRTVAIKVLPAHVADDPDLRQRFEREAKTISSLNHPHICTLYDIGTQDGIDFLVMEYLDGETLAQRLEKGALPVDQALQVAIEIADALDKAHRQGIVHRDLKPGNIMLTKAGAKLLDFGLAKPIAVSGVGPASAMATQSAGLTGEGNILGTLQYMAPEQLEGKEADHRTDIFAFGTTVYEMITGQRAFSGGNQASLIHAIMGVDPPAMSSLQVVSPHALDRIVKTCLTKDLEERWQSAGDMKRQLKWVTESGEQAGAAALGPATMPPRAGWWQAIRWVVGAVVFGFVIGLTVWTLMRPSVRPVVRSAVTPPASEPLNLRVADVNLGLSPDGSRLVYRASLNGQPHLFVRALGELQATPLLGLGSNPRNPFVSADGNWVGFFDSGENLGLRKVSIHGGPASTITPVKGGAKLDHDGGGTLDHLAAGRSV